MRTALALRSRQEGSSHVQALHLCRGARFDDRSGSRSAGWRPRRRPRRCSRRRLRRADRFDRPDRAFDHRRRCRCHCRDQRQPVGRSPFGQGRSQPQRQCRGYRQHQFAARHADRRGCRQCQRFGFGRGPGLCLGPADRHRCGARRRPERGRSGARRCGWGRQRGRFDRRVDHRLGCWLRLGER
jgi:hypothetical protein